MYVCNMYVIIRRALKDQVDAALNSVFEELRIRIGARQRVKLQLL